MGRYERGSQLLVEKPWGYYETLLNQSGFTVKMLYVNPGQRLSLQRHEKREEHWVCVAGYGQADLYPSAVPYFLSAGDHVNIDVDQAHRLTNTDKQRMLIIVETQIGICDEDDIFRYEDDYGRVDEKA